MWTWAILTTGTETFVPVFNRLREIVKEFVPYLIRIGIGAVGINALREAVRWSMMELENKTKWTFREKKYGKRRKKGKQVYYIKTKKWFKKITK